MSEKFYVGLDLTSSEDNGTLKPISRVTLLVDNENSYTAGDDTGRELVADCAHATQAMVDSILAQVKGYQYQAYSATDANIDPAAELGDGVTADGMYSVISRMDDDGSGYMGLSAPGEAEMEDEYPSTGPMTQEFTRQLAQTRSLITKTAEEIRLEVANEVEGLSTSVTVELGKITGRVDDAEESIEVTLTTLNGLTVTDSTGTTKIKGSSVETDTLYVNAANITGTLTASQINTTGLKVSAANITGTLTIGQLPDTVAETSDIPTKTSQLTNNSDFQTESGVTSIINGTVTTDFVNALSVTARKIQGQTVSLLSSSGSTSGTIKLTAASSGAYAVDITSNAALRLTAADGAIYLSANGASIMLYNGNTTFTGSIKPNDDGGTYCGTTTQRWAGVCASTGTIITSDRNQKHDIETLPNKYLDMLLELPVYRFKMDQGTSDRYHVGYIAQDVEEYMAKHDIDSLEFAGFVKDVDEDGNAIYMLRYDEFEAIHTLAVQRHESKFAEQKEEMASLKAELQNLMKRLEMAGL